ncbi:LPXTG cell wall anchor domain-containing protein [Dactylosporangium sp. NPDC050588]|uniref:LPXTG cell wall anchor domain-containing protein n=1 Tax=Dactylosporangium sp. NPDC050588 TaxID=3157211 RepID=UPI0033E59573
MTFLSRLSARRTGAALAASALVFAALPATSALAEDDFPSVGAATSYDIGLGAVGTPGKAVTVWVDAHNAVKPRFEIDQTGLAGVATFAVPDGNDQCKATGKKIVCDLPQADFTSVPIVLVLHPDKGAAVGDKGAFTLDAIAENTPDLPASEHKVTIADGADLVVTAPTYVSPVPEVKPGDVLFTKAAFVNYGNRAAADATMTMMFDPGIAPFKYEGCTYTETEYPLIVECPVDGTIEPGAGREFVTVDENGKETPGMGAVVAPDALGWKGVDFLALADSVVEDLPPEVLAKAKTTKATSGKKFKIRQQQPVNKSFKAQPEIDKNDNYAGTAYGALNSRDLATIGATASGGVGSVVTVNIGVKNTGVSMLDAYRTGGEPAARFNFVVPDGTEVVGVGEGCVARWKEDDGSIGWDPVPGKRFYDCGIDSSLFKPGASYTTAFQLKITQVIAHATGTVSFTNPFRDPAEPPADANPGNDVAEVVINPNPGGSGGGLPLTGAQTGLVASVGAALLAGGVALFLVARRRRVVLVVPQDGSAE